MTEPYAKLVCSILDSSVWSEPSDVRIVWVTLLAMADKTGFIGASIDGLAKRARVSERVAVEAMRRFSEPDPYSRSEDHEGRRVVKVERGWKLLNYEAVRDAWKAEERRQYQAEWVREKRRQLSTPVDNCRVDTPDQIRSETNTDQTPPIPPSEPSKPKRSRRRKTACERPSDLKPTPEQQARAKRIGVNCNLEFEKFCSHHEAIGTLFASWTAGFTTWLINCEKWGPGPPARGKQQSTPDHEAARLEANSRQLHRQWLKEQAESGAFGPKAKAHAEAGTLDLDRLEAHLAEQKAKRNATT